MPQAMTKPVEVTYFPLIDASACAAALDAALTIGFRGSVGAWMNGDTEIWTVELSGGPLDQKAVLVVDGDTARPPTVGDIYVWNGTRLQCFTAAQFDAAYTPI